jgi:uncharacterized membrane protein (DUF4010 family)
LVNKYYSTKLKSKWVSFYSQTLTPLTIEVKKEEQKEGKEEDEGIPDMQNPFEIRPAVWFGVLFVLLSVLTGFVRQTIGDSGLLVLSAVVGVSDIDPFILSVIQGADGAVQIFTSAIMISLMSNTIAKGIYFAFLSSTTRKETVWRFMLWAGLHLPLIFG